MVVVGPPSSRTRKYRTASTSALGAVSRFGPGSIGCVPAHSGLSFRMRRGTRGLFRSSRAILKMSSGRLPSASTPRRFSSTLASATICSIFVSGRLGASGMAIQRICAHGRHVSSSIGARHNQTGPLPRGWYRRPGAGMGFRWVCCTHGGGLFRRSGLALRTQRRSRPSFISTRQRSTSTTTSTIC
jgi:hypothetical protein